MAGVKRSASSSGTMVVKKSKGEKKRVRGIPMSLNFHKFIRACSTQFNQRLGMDLFSGFTYNGSNTGFFNLAFAFTLGGVLVYSGGTLITTLVLPNFAEFQALYDQYRIDWVDCQFMFSNNYSNVNSPTTVLPIVYLAKDYDDTLNANVTDLQQYSTLQTWQLGTVGDGGIKHVRVKPNINTLAYQSLGSGYVRGKPSFVDTSTSTVQHYGVKLAFDPIAQPAAATLVGYLSVNFVYHMTLSHSK